MVELSTFKVKGAPLMADVEFLKERHGEEGFQEVLAAMPDQYAKVYRGGISPKTWYTMDLRKSILDAMDKVHANGNMDYFWELGCFQARHNISNFYLTFVQAVGPKVMMMLGQVYWRLIYATSSIKVHAETGRFIIEVRDYPEVGEHNCHVVRGYIHASLALTGDVKESLTGVETSCINHGDATCTFVYSWG